MTKINFTNHLSVDQLFVTAVQHHQVGDYKQAEIIYHHILGLDPAHYLSLNNLGLINLQLGRNNQAEEYFKHAITANSNYFIKFNAHARDEIFHSSWVDDNGMIINIRILYRLI